jgi:hypothetical protein
VFFRHESVSAFRFAPTFIAEVGQGANVSTETIHLEQPFRLREPVPEGLQALLVLPGSAFSLRLLPKTEPMPTLLQRKTSAQKARPNRAEVRSRTAVARCFLHRGRGSDFSR